MTLKFNKLKKTVQNVRTNPVKMSPISQFEKFMRCEGEGHKCSHVDVMQKNTNRFFVFQDSGILDVMGDICPCICDHHTAYIAYWCLYCVQKWNNIDSDPILRGSAGFEWNHVVWFNQSHITWSAGNKMAATIPCGRNFHWTTWYGSANHSCNDVNKMAAPIRTPGSITFV